MKLERELNEFNQLLADDLKLFFESDIEVFQDEHETLLFRGPAPSISDKDNVGSHVTVKLDEETKNALNSADQGKRTEMMQDLVNRLSSEIKTTYDRNGIGEYAKSFIGTMKIVDGK